MDSGWGYFRDEFYYLACARHLAWGYVDHPPLSIAVLRLWTDLFGGSIAAIRALPALLGVLTAALTGLTARRLGGGRYAISLAMLCVAVAPEYLALFGYYSMNSFDVLFWTLAAYVLVRILHDGEERGWPWLGVVLGLGLLNKLSVLWLGLGIGVGLILTAERKRLLTRGPWLAAAIALVIAAPHAWWQVQNGWPTAEFVRHATREKMKAISPLDFFEAQVNNQHPFAAPVWLLGLAFALFASGGRRVRLLGVLYLTVFTLLVVNQNSRAGYLSAAYPMLLACGAVWIEALTNRFRWLRLAALALLVVGGLVTAPLVVPVLSPDGYVEYARRLGVEPSTEEKKEIGLLPQFFADRTGWPELVRKVEGALADLTPQERAHATVFTSNYGQAGAMETLSRVRVLTVSGHNNYWLWGPGAGPSDPLLVLASAEARTRLDGLCHSVEDRGPMGCPYCMPYESQTHLFVCRGLNPPLAARWPQLKHFD